jgi:hypothetical protein
MFRWLFILLPLFLTAPAFGSLKWRDSVLTVHAVPEAKRIVARFAFENTGATPVTITAIRTNCGCTAADAGKKTWQPGEHGAVTVAFEIGSRRGLYETPITVLTNDPAAPQTVLKFRPLIRDVVEIAPTFVFWKPGEPLAPKGIAVKVTTPEPVEELLVSSSNPAVDARVETVSAGREFRVTVTPSPEAGRAKAALTITARQAGREPRQFVARVKVH